MSEKILECHTRGDGRFSPFNTPVYSFGVWDSIENHYQRTKIFEIKDEESLFDEEPRYIKSNDWRDSKNYKGQKIYQFVLPNGESLGNSNRSLDDLVIQYYIFLWWKYLRVHPELIEYASGFDKFVDIFKGNFPFCQADVIEHAVKYGVESLLNLCKDFTNYAKEKKFAKALYSENVVIGNKHKRLTDKEKLEIHRPSPFGNPFSHMEGTTAEFKVESRWEAVMKFKEYFRNSDGLKDKLKMYQGRKLELVCYCAPLDCHGVIIKQFLDENTI